MITGSLAALITPFRDGQIDREALRSLVRWHIEQGTDGLVPVGTTGESAMLSRDEHCTVVELVAAEADGRVTIVAGAGSNNPSEAIDYTRHAAECGADATLHIAGYYNRPNQEGLYQHYRTVHDATDLPIVVYNNPARAVVDILPDTLARIAELPRVVGIKDATGDLNRPLLEQQRITEGFSWLSGEDGTAIAYNAAGGNGCISVTANVAPKLCAEMQSAWQSGEYADAMLIQRRLMPLHTALFAEPSPAGAKFAVSLLGFCEEECRLPVVPLSEATRQRIASAMATLGLIDGSRDASQRVA